jgi:glucosamine--fructose-6-phosphate aminotransferase (isomerizing)
MAAQYVIEDMSGVPVRVELASEFRYRRLLLPEGALVIVISQSGETADSLAALREAKRLGARTLAVVNVVGSTIAREADNVLYTLAGPEIAVATTKAYAAQLAAMYALAVALGRAKGMLDAAACARLVGELTALPDKIARVLEDKERIQWFAAKFASARDIFFIGRGLDYAVSLEGSLKMKEISYIHSEAYAAGELKHGTIALIEEGTPVVALITQPELYEKMVSNIVEVKARGAVILAIAPEDYEEIHQLADGVLTIPKTFREFSPILAVTYTQLFAYYTSVIKGCDVDKPRNLAKSVTVE